MGTLSEPDQERAADPPRVVDLPRLVDLHRAVVLHRWSRVLRWSAATLMVLPVPVVVWALKIDEPVVVARFLVEPLLVGPALAGVATVVAVCAAMVGLSAQEAGASPGSRRWFVRWPVNLAKFALLVVAWAGAGLAFLVGAFSGEAHLLSPTSPGGCRVVVVEHAYGGAALYVAPAGSFRSRPAGEVRDAGAAPVSRGSYDLTWDGETADLVLRGVSDSAWPERGAPAEAVVDCAAPSGGPG